MATAVIDQFTTEHAKLQEDPKRLDLEERAVAKANELADEHVFRPTKGFGGFVELTRQAFVPPKAPKIRPDDLAAQRAQFIDGVLPGVRQNLRLGNLMEELRELAADKQHVTAVVNSKGGSAKTPVSVYAAVTLNTATRHPTLLVDANENDGGTSHAVGVERVETASILDVVHNPDGFHVPAEIWGKLFKTPPDLSVYVVSSVPNGQMYDGISKEAFAAAYQRLKYHGAHSMFIDCGNGSVVPTNHAAVNVASTLTFSAVIDDPASLRGILTTMLAYTNRGYEPKVRKALITVSKCEGQTSEYIYKMLQDEARNTTFKHDGHDEISNLTLDMFDIKPERIFPIPFDDYIASRRPAQFGSIELATQIAYLEYLVAMYSQDEDYTNTDPSMGIDFPKEKLS